MDIDCRALDQKLHWLLNNIDFLQRRQEFLAFEPYERKKVMTACEDRTGDLPREFIEGRWGARLLDEVKPSVFFVHRSPDIYVSNSILLSGSWETQATNFLFSELDGQCGTFLDVGANIGWFSHAVASKFADADVLAIEPDPENARILRTNVSFNGLCNVKTFEVAVSDRPSTSKLYLSEVNRGDHQLDVSEGWRRAVTVNSVTLDSLMPEIDKPLKWLKMDIQGLEGKAVSGGQELIARFRPLIIMEFWRDKLGEGARDLIQFFDSQDYQLCQLEDRPTTSLVPIADITSLPGEGIDVVLRPKNNL